MINIIQKNCKVITFEKNTNQFTNFDCGEEHESTFNAFSRNGDIINLKIFVEYKHSEEK